MEEGPDLPVLGRRCAASPVCTESSVQGVCLVIEKDSWAVSNLVLILSHSYVPLNSWWDYFGSPQCVLAPWGRGDLSAEDVPVRNIVLIKKHSDQELTSEQPLTGDDHKRCKTGKQGEVQIHPVKALWKLHDRVNPVSKAVGTLLSMEDHTVAEDKLILLWIWPVEF